MDWETIVEHWEKLLPVPVITVLAALARRCHPLKALQRLWSFRIGVNERAMLLALVEAEKASGLRWRTLWETCQEQLSTADDRNAQLRTRLDVWHEPGDGGMSEH